MNKEKIKEIIKMIVRIAILIIIIYILFEIFMVISIFTEGDSKDKMEKYESKTVRMEYYEKHKENFNYFVNLFSQSSEIVLIDYKKGFNSCSTGEIESYLSKDIHICSLKPLEMTQEQEKEIVNKFKQMEDLYSIVKTTDFDNTDDLGYLTFFLVNSFGGAISYNYCLSFDYCSSEDFYREYDNGYIEENNIDERWSSTFNSTSAL